MSKVDPVQCDYLALVSEWSSLTPHGGIVGNAFPIFNLEKKTVVASPEDDFPNPGTVFLTNRGGLKTWDYVVLRPKENERYQNLKERDCYYIFARHPDVVNSPEHLESVATILDHPTFEVNSNTRQLQNPVHNVTPYFFVRRGETIFGPLIRVVAQLSMTDDVQRIEWRPVGDDGVVYEFGADEFKAQGMTLVEYRHPKPYLNRVIGQPIEMAVGKVRDVRSKKAHDVLPIAAVIDWYLRRCPAATLPDGALNSLRSAFRAEATDDLAIVNARLRRIDRGVAHYQAFADHLERFGKEFLESDAGKQRIQEMIDQTVKKKESQIQIEVDRREHALASRRDELARQLLQTEAEHIPFAVTNEAFPCR